MLNFLHAMKFLMILSSTEFFFKLTFPKKTEALSECQNVWIQIRSYVFTKIISRRPQRVKVTS